MTPIFRAALVAGMALTVTPVIAAGQDTTRAGLLRRVALLEMANADLARRVRALEAAVGKEPSLGEPVTTSAKWRDLANWRQLRMGMRMNEVRALLGEPERVDAGPLTFWRWPAGDVVFTDDKVSGWSEPTP